MRSKFNYRAFSIVVFLLSNGLVAPSLQADDFEFWEPEASVQQECQPGVQYQRNAQGVCEPVTSLNATQPIKKPLVQSKLAAQNKGLPSCFTVKGQASTEGVANEFAKKMAIREALKNASMQRNLEVNSDVTLQNQTVLLENERFVSRSQVQSYTLLKEGLEDPLDVYGQEKPKPLNYEVELDVCLSAKRGLCPDLNGRQYAPSLLVAPLAVEDVAGVRDLRNLVIGYQQELERRLQDSGQPNIHSLLGAVDIQANLRITPNLDQQLLEDLYDQSGAQYLLLSVLRSATSLREEQGWGTQIQRYYNQALEDDSRYIEVDWYVLDLLDKQVVHQVRNGFDLKGAVRVNRDRMFGTNAFFATDTGKAFDQLLQYQSANVLEFLHCKRLVSKVIDVRDGKYYLFLNAESGVQVGDDLAVYHRIGAPVNVSGRSLGSEYEPGAFLKVTAIQANFAIAELSASKNVVQIGDLVRPW
ncbi:hypothetical protein THMIRHAS_08770 [Thiosulfatimonas sediminis]|uniref:Flagellar assembly protein T middle domain-containing protein n=1 Tax=Thiosulfatimonas sediminis TaxID=2675054 RepID=A0A6F8PU11_9GAMM|nr:hypothetical protein [Thiosulfatimonas sediminis]BBP45504.1 hypothetical protein THMIRHAS_08770 [Thiosulfatimonas sediminis]